MLSERVWSHKGKYYVIPPEELARLVKSVGAERRWLPGGVGNEEVFNAHGLWRLLTAMLRFLTILNYALENSQDGKFCKVYFTTGKKPFFLIPNFFKLGFLKCELIDLT